MREIELRAAALCIAGGKVLLVNHRKHGESYWVLPGGHVEHGESLADALAREMDEELGLDVTVGPLALVHDFITGKRHVVNHVFRIDLDNDAFTLSPGKTLKDARWVPLDEIDAIDLRPAIAKHLRRFAEPPDGDGPVYLGNV